MSTTATSTWVLADLLRQSASPPLRLCGHEYPLLLLLTGPFSSPTDHHRSCCLRYQLSGCCNGSYRKDLAPNVDPAFRRRYFRRRRSTRPELYAMNTRRSTRPLCLVWQLPRRGGVLGICSTWQCHSCLPHCSLFLVSPPRASPSRCPTPLARSPMRLYERLCRLDGIPTLRHIHTLLLLSAASSFMKTAETMGECWRV